MLNLSSRLPIIQQSRKHRLSFKSLAIRRARGQVASQSTFNELYSAEIEATKTDPINYGACTKSERSLNDNHLVDLFRSALDSDSGIVPGDPLESRTQSDEARKMFLSKHPAVERCCPKCGIGLSTHSNLPDANLVSLSDSKMNS
jgi:hypothetical protein